MKAITEREAQELANNSGSIVAVDEDGEVVLFSVEFPPEPEKGNWVADRPLFFDLPIRISSTRPWTEQIWRPETKVEVK